MIEFRLTKLLNVIKEAIISLIQICIDKSIVNIDIIVQYVILFVLLSL